MMNIFEISLAFFGPFIYIFLLTCTFIYIFRRKLNFSSALPVAIMSSVVFVYLFTVIFHNILFGFIVTLIFGAFSIPLIFLDKYRRKLLKEQIFTPGFFVFALLYVFLFILNWLKVVPLLSDSSMHWAPHVWTMLLRNDFYTSPNLSLVIHGDYPPFIQLFELIWIKAAGMYREGLLFFAIQILSFSMLLPILSKFSWTKARKKDWLMILLFTCTFITIPMIFFVSNFYSSLDVDTVLAFIFAYGAYLAFTESRKFTVFGVLNLSLATTFIIMSKQIL